MAAAMKKLTLVLFASMSVTACGKDTPKPQETKVERITLTVGGKTFVSTLSDTRAAQQFAALLPLTLKMQELNGNEKYADLPSRLTTESTCHGTIEAGDIMLYGRDCIVVFYETFKSSYSYTRIGHITDTAGLKEALGKGKATTTFAAR